MNAHEALRRLLAGNRRYREGKPAGAGRDAARRKATAAAQAPIAVVLTCSDSRVPPEIIFDQGIGDIFAVRVAGNVEDDLVCGSIEYAAAHLGAELVLVLGHSRCGAVTVALGGGEPGAHTGACLAPLAPALEAACGCAGDAAAAAVARENARLTAERLRGCPPLLADLAARGKLLVKAAYYDLESGAVELLED